MVTIEEEEADLTWVFIIGAVAIIVLGIGLIILCKKMRKETKLADDVYEERKKGLTPSWGTKSSLAVENEKEYLGHLAVALESDLKRLE